LKDNVFKPEELLPIRNDSLIMKLENLRNK